MVLLSMAWRPNGGEGSLVEFPRLPRFSRESLGALRWVALAVLGLLFVLSAVYTIKTEEIGVILRLGKYRGRENDARPGIHFKLPLLDQVYKVPVERQLKAEFGFRTEEVAIKSRYTEAPGGEASMLTGDLNAAMVEWVVQYRITDPYLYLFRVRNVEGTFRDMSEAVMRKIVGDRTVNEVLTIGRSEIEGEAVVQLQELCDQYETGVRVEQVVLQTINPPDPVKPSFNEVNQAEQELERLINEAQAEYNRVVPRADGEARQTLEQAEGYALDRVNRAEGDGARFSSLYAEYQKAPEVTRKRIYLETMNRVLKQAGRKLVIDDQLEGLIPMLDVQRLEAISGAAASQPGGN